MCGVGHSSSESQTCKQKRCPCVKGNIPCGVACKCRNCSNPAGHFVGIKEKRCRCGENKTKVQESGDETKKQFCKVRCPCSRMRVSCADPPVCYCYECTNPYGSKNSEPMKRVTQERRAGRRSQQSSAGKLSRYTMKEFFEMMKLHYNDSRWNPEETLLLHYCKFTLKNKLCQEERREMGLLSLYNSFAIHFPNCRKKSSNQIMHKLNYHEKRNKLYNL